MLLNVTSAEGVLLTTYGKLQPPLGKHRLKVICCSHLYDLFSTYNASFLIIVIVIHKHLNLFLFPRL